MAVKNKDSPGSVEWNRLIGLAGVSIRQPIALMCYS